MLSGAAGTARISMETNMKSGVLRGTASLAMLLMILPLCGSEGPALSESRIVKLSINSTYTKRPMPFIVYLPEGYGGGDAYPVWYGLHGYGSDENMWIRSVSADKAADAAISSGETKPLIMVFPITRYDSVKEVQENRDKDGKFGEQYYDQFVSKELVPYIDSHYDTLKSASGRAIGGFSMGGMIALRIAFHHPDMFGKAAGFSAAVPSSDFSDRQLEKWLFPNDNVDEMTDIDGFDRDKGFAAVRVYLDCGTVNDTFFPGLQSLNECLLKKGIKSEFHTFEGGHDISHVKKDITQYFRFFTS